MIAATRALALCVVLSAAAALACECRKGSPESSIETADALFEARVTAVDQEGEDWLVKVTIGRRWKGLASGTPLTLRSRTGKRCGYYFQAGKTYLVAAMKDGEHYRVTTCGLTVPIEKAGELIARLPAPAK